MKRTYKGFTLIELMIVVAIVAFLSMISVPNFLRFLQKAKRVEAFVNLGSLYAAQTAYRAEHGKYSSQLTGKDGVGWQPEGKHYYTYGFNTGSPNQNYFVGSSNASSTQLGNTKADAEGFVAAAVAVVNGVVDRLTVDQFNNIQITSNALE